MALGMEKQQQQFTSPRMCQASYQRRPLEAEVPATNEVHQLSSSQQSGRLGCRMSKGSSAQFSAWLMSHL
jgi:hypothetical protein